MKEKMQIEVSVIIPIYNEQEIIPELYSRLQKSVSKISQNYELIFVNDGSKDASIQELKKIANTDSHVLYINFSRNFGHQIAVTAGLHHATGNAIVIIDGDLQDPPELIPELYAKYKEGYKIVGAKRVSRKGETFFKKVTAKAYYRILKRITNVDIPVDTGDYRLIDRKVVQAILAMDEPDKYIRGQVAWTGFKTTFVNFERDERRFGTTGYSLKKMTKFAIDGITSFSSYPLKLASIFGFIVSGFAFCMVVYVLLSKYVFQTAVEGWPSLMLTILFLGGVQLICLGIIGEYLWRIMNTVRNRPLYIIEETNIES
ncbi:MAG TPA: glycosyltransferase family 2 protein [Bacteroidales bacterium]|jgi:dolichol-phosphate mannosyltransferase|nr:glycosyltransferase family 2 protein [Bacteroidales bacterium]